MKTNRWRSRAGQSLVEMAMVLPILAFLTFGLLDFGRAYYFQVSVTNAAREGARVAILNIYTGPQTPTCTGPAYSTCPVQTDAAITTAVTNELTYSNITPKSVTICPPHDSTMSTQGCPDTSNRVDKWMSGTSANANYYVTVNVKYDFQLYTPLMQNLLGNPLTMSVSVQMRTNY
ncbi:MAG TPA: TadE/TadG family type IV pilus assembly protein [Candidatus Dormibacteraeota bacterium]|nr:TadE/TadG family type IV pilus assembly protein [Candidatus Dormibacteraeota bacterium]